MLGKVCVGGGALDKQYKAIKASPTISSVLHIGPYGLRRIGKPVNKKVFPMTILNNNKYSGHCTLYWGFSKHEAGSISVITSKVFYLPGVTLKELLLLCGDLWL